MQGKNLLKTQRKARNAPSCCVFMAWESWRQQQHLGSDLELWVDHSGSEVGSSLLHDVGVKTKNLQPPLTFVPWLLYNDVTWPSMAWWQQCVLRHVSCFRSTPMSPWSKVSTISPGSSAASTFTGERSVRVTRNIVFNKVQTTILSQSLHKRQKIYVRVKLNMYNIYIQVLHTSASTRQICFVAGATHQLFLLQL